MLRDQTGTLQAYIMELLLLQVTNSIHLTLRLQTHLHCLLANQHDSCITDVVIHAPLESPADNKYTSHNFPSICGRASELWMIRHDVSTLFSSGVCAGVQKSGSTKSRGQAEAPRLRYQPAAHAR